MKKTFGDLQFALDLASTRAEAAILKTVAMRLARKGFDPMVIRHTMLRHAEEAAAEAIRWAKEEDARDAVSVTYEIST